MKMMKPVIASLLVLSPSMIGAQSGTVIGLKPDKIKHVAAGAFIAGSIQTFAYEMGCSRSKSLLLGFGAGCVSAAAKELYDLTGYGTSSLRDAFWTGIGVGVASVTLHCSIEKKHGRSHRKL